MMQQLSSFVLHIDIILPIGCVKNWCTTVRKSEATKVMIDSEHGNFHKGPCGHGVYGYKYILFLWLVCGVAAAP